MLEHIEGDCFVGLKLNYLGSYDFWVVLWLQLGLIQAFDANISHKGEAQSLKDQPKSQWESTFLAAAAWFFLENVLMFQRLHDAINASERGLNKAIRCCSTYYFCFSWNKPECRFLKNLNLILIWPKGNVILTCLWWFSDKTHLVGM